MLQEITLAMTSTSYTQPSASTSSSRPELIEKRLKKKKKRLKRQFIFDHLWGIPGGMTKQELNLIRWQSKIYVTVQPVKKHCHLKKPSVKNQFDCSLSQRGSEVSNTKGAFEPVSFNSCIFQLCPGHPGHWNCFQVSNLSMTQMHILVEHVENS